MSRRRARPPRRPVAIAGADLHVHTTHSDGRCSPGEVVRAAGSVGLRALAITDHDTCSAVAGARPEAERLGIELVAGVEISAGDEGREIHLLGHFVDPGDPALIEALGLLKRAREGRFDAMVDRLAALGFAGDAEGLRRAFPRATLGRRHLADALVRTRQVETHRLVFARLLGDDGPAAVPKPLIPWERAVSLIRGAGGVASLAHPPRGLRPDRLRSYRDGGLGGLEVAGPGVDRRDSERRRGRAEALGLVPIAGSDFLAPDRPGRWVGAIVTPPEDLERLRDAAAGPPRP